MDYLHMTAPCGLDCWNCPVYRARDDEALRLRLAPQFGLEPDQVRCDGCRAENGTIGALRMEGPCNVFQCISAKGLDFCGECDKFPCEHLHPYADHADRVPHNTKVYNLCLIKRLGLEAWAKDKAASVRKTYYHGKWKL